MPVSMRRNTALALAVAGFMLGTAGAEAQQIVARVNGEPITAYEVEQRIRINRLARQSTSRGAALQELIDDRVKLAEARRVGYRLTDENVDDQISRIAKGNNQTMIEFAQNLSKVGVDMNAYRQKLKAQYAWELTMDRRQRGSENPTDMIFTDKGGSGARIDYTLHSVIFVVPGGVGAGARMAEANAARARFNDCASGLQMLRGMRDVAVKSAVRRSSDGLSPQLNKILEATPANRLTQPFPSAQGIEVVAVCEKTVRGGGRPTTSSDDSKKKVSDSQAYLKELRAKSVIQTR